MCACPSTYHGLPLIVLIIHSYPYFGIVLQVRLRKEAGDLISADLATIVSLHILVMVNLVAPEKPSWASISQLVQANGCVL
jgi:hypothetical protein